MSTTPETIPATKPDEGLVRRVETGRLFTAGLMGVAFAASLTVVGSSLQGELVSRAMFALVSAMPLLAVHFVATSPGHEERYVVSFLMRTMPVLGFLSAVIGLGMLFENAIKHTGVVFGVVSVACAWVCVSSNERGLMKLKQKRSEPAPESVRPASVRTND